MTFAKKVKKGKYTYFEEWDKGKFIRHIGNAEKLAKWQKDQDKAKAILNPSKPVINKPGNKNEQEWHGFRLKTPLEKVNSVISVNEIPESPQEKSRVLGTFGKSGNKNNTFNTSNPAEPSTELPDCRCGANEWVMQPDGSLYCPKCFNTTEVNQ